MDRGYRVGLDLWPALTHAPGAGRYARELTRALARLPDAPPLRLLDVGPGPRTWAPALDLHSAPAGWSRLHAELPRGALRALAGLGLPAERLLGGCELFHRILPGEPPLGPRLPRVQALAELPAPGSQAERDLRRALAGPTDVVVFSAVARTTVVRRLELDPARVHALAVGCDHWLGGAAPRDELTGPPLVLALGRTDRARGPLALLGAFERLRERGIEARLVLCGRPGDVAGPLRAAIARSPFRADARWIDDPDERGLPALVASAAVLVHLSAQEWTPVTPLEGAAAGAAVLASTLPAFEEALGDEAVWASGSPDELDRESLAAALEQALESGLDPALRRRRRALAARFTWARHATGTVDLWRRILAR